jgi:hypothetical protein
MSSSLNLSTFAAVQQSTFVKMTVMEAGTPVVIRMSSHSVPFAITESDGVSYTYPAVGALLGVTQITSDLKATASDVSITLSAIPNQYMADIIANPIKGSPVEIRRAFFNANSSQILDIPGNPVLEFSGVVNNFSFDEGWSAGEQSVTTTATLVCSSIMSVLAKRVSGRRTNQADQNFWFPGDTAFNRVAVIADATFDFGSNKTNVVAAASQATSVTTSVTG